MFEEHEDSMEAAFRLAVDMVNDDKQTLVRTRLTATPELIPHGDSFKASQKGTYNITYIPYSTYLKPWLQKI